MPKSNNIGTEPNFAPAPRVEATEWPNFHTCNTPFRVDFGAVGHSCRIAVSIDESPAVRKISSSPPAGGRSTGWTEERRLRSQP